MKKVIPICKYCKHMEPFSQTCYHHKSMSKMDPITGEYSFYSCRFMRASFFRCGTKGRYYEDRPIL